MLKKFTNWLRSIFCTENKLEIVEEKCTCKCDCDKSVEIDKTAEINIHGKDLTNVGRPNAQNLEQLKPAVEKKFEKIPRELRKKNIEHIEPIPTSIPNMPEDLKPHNHKPNVKPNVNIEHIEPQKPTNPNIEPAPEGLVLNKKESNKTKKTNTKKTVKKSNKTAAESQQQEKVEKPKKKTTKKTTKKEGKKD